MLDSFTNNTELNASTSFESGAAFKPYPLGYTIGIGSLIALLLVSTIFGNVLVIVAIHRQPKLQTPNNVLITSLAVADLLVGAFVMPVSMTTEISKVWFLGNIICELFIIADVFLCTSSILNLLAIAVDRLWAVTDYTYAKTRTYRKTIGMAALAWTVSFLVAIAEVLFNIGRGKADVNRTGVCIISQNKIYTVISVGMAFYLPCFIIMGIYWKIYVVSRNRLLRMQGRTVLGRFTKTIPNTGTCVTVSATEGQALLNGTATCNVPVVVPTDDVGCGGGTGDDVPELATMSLTPLSSKAQLAPPTSPDHVGLPLREVRSAPTSRGCSLLSTDIELTNEMKVDTMNSLTVASVSERRIRSYTTCNDRPESSDDKKSTTSSTADFKSFRRLISSSFRRVRARPQITVESSPERVNEMERLKREQAELDSQMLRSKRLKQFLLERKTSVTLAILTSCFMISWLPFFLLAAACPFMGELCRVSAVFSTMFRVFTWFGYANSGVNPVIYSIFNAEFREAFKALLRCHAVSRTQAKFNRRNFTR